MSKVVVVVLTDTETHESRGRVVNALEFAKELRKNDDEVAIIFDGAGTKWIPELEDEQNNTHPLYEAIKRDIVGACKFCAKAFGVINEIRESNVSLLNDYDQHPSLRNYIVEGYQIVTF